MEIIYDKGLTVSTHQEVLKHCVAKLEAEGFVKETYLEAILKREEEYPTGIESSTNFALCHTDTEHVLEDCLYVVNLNDAVSFNNMAEPSQELMVKLVFILVFKSPESHLKALQSLVAFMLEEADVNTLMESNSETGAEFLKEKLEEGSK